MEALRAMPEPNIIYLAFGRLHALPNISCSLLIHQPGPLNSTVKRELEKELNTWYRGRWFTKDSIVPPEKQFPPDVMSLVDASILIRCHSFVGMHQSSFSWGISQFRLALNRQTMWVPQNEPLWVFTDRGRFFYPGITNPRNMM
jgi:hypothetical protein